MQLPCYSLEDSPPTRSQGRGSGENPVFLIALRMGLPFCSAGIDEGSNRSWFKYHRFFTKF